MADTEYNKKMEDLQQFTPFLNRMITQLKSQSDPGNQTKSQRLAKIEYLYSIIAEKKKLKLETLTKCEEVIRGLHDKAKNKTQVSVAEPASTSIKTEPAQRKPIPEPPAQKKAVSEPAQKKPITAPEKPSSNWHHYNHEYQPKPWRTNPVEFSLNKKQSVFDRLARRNHYTPHSEFSFEEELTDLRHKLQKQVKSEEGAEEFENVQVTREFTPEETREAQEDGAGKKTESDVKLCVSAKSDKHNEISKSSDTIKRESLDGKPKPRTSDEKSQRRNPEHDRVKPTSLSPRRITNESRLKPTSLSPQRLKDENRLKPRMKDEDSKYRERYKNKWEKEKPSDSRDQRRSRDKSREPDISKKPYKHYQRRSPERSRDDRKPYYKSPNRFPIRPYRRTRSRSSDRSSNDDKKFPRKQFRSKEPRRSKSTDSDRKRRPRSNSFDRYPKKIYSKPRSRSPDKINYDRARQYQAFKDKNRSNSGSSDDGRRHSTKNLHYRRRSSSSESRRYARRTKYEYQDEKRKREGSESSEDAKRHRRRKLSPRINITYEHSVNKTEYRYGLNLEKLATLSKDTPRNSLLQEMCKNISKGVIPIKPEDISDIPLPKSPKKKPSTDRAVQSLQLSDVSSRCSPQSMELSPISDSGEIETFDSSSGNKLQTRSNLIQVFPPLPSCSNTPPPPVPDCDLPPTLSPQNRDASDSEKPNLHVSGSNPILPNDTNEQQKKPPSRAASEDRNAISSTSDHNRDKEEKVEGSELGDKSNPMDIINTFLKKLLENESTRDAVSAFIENVSTSLDGDKLQSVASCITASRKKSPVKQTQTTSDEENEAITRKARRRIRKIVTKISTDEEDEDAVVNRKTLSSDEEKRRVPTRSKRKPPKTSSEDEDSEEEEVARRRIKTRYRKVSSEESSEDSVYERKHKRKPKESSDDDEVPRRKTKRKLRKVTTDEESEEDSPYERKRMRDHPRRTGKKKFREAITYKEPEDFSSETESKTFRMKTKKKFREAVRRKESEQDSSSSSSSETETKEKSDDEDDLRPKIKGKFQKKSELDILHEDLRTMFNRHGNLTSTGQRTCTILKDDAYITSRYRAPKNLAIKFDMKAPENRKELKKLRSLYVIIPPHEQLLDGPKSPEQANRKDLPAQKVGRAVERSEKANQKDPPAQKIRPSDKVNQKDPPTPKTRRAVERSPEKDDKQYSLRRPSNENSKAGPSGLRSNQKEGASYSLRPPKEPIKGYTDNDSDEEKLISQIMQLIEKEIDVVEKNPVKEKKIDVVEKNPVKDSVQVEPAQKLAPRKQKKKKQDAPAEPQSDLEFIEPDKNYYSSRNQRCYSRCKVCSYGGKYITNHYRMYHPEYEVLSSRLMSSKAAEAIKESIKLKLDVSEEHVLNPKGHYAFKCRFCDVHLNTSPSVFFDHISAHTGEYRFSCDICRFGCTKSSTLRRHFTAFHTIDQYKNNSSPVTTKVYGYLCLECNFVQNSKKSLENHVNIYHLGEGRKIVKIYLSSLDYLIPNEHESSDPPVLEKQSPVVSEKPIPKKIEPSPQAPVLEKQVVSPVKRKKPGPKCKTLKKQRLGDILREALVKDVASQETETCVKVEDVADDLTQEVEVKVEIVDPPPEAEAIVKTEPPIKNVDMTVFTCNTEIEDEELRLAQERLDTLVDSKETDKAKRQSSSIIDHLSNKLLKDEPEEIKIEQEDDDLDELDNIDLSAIEDVCFSEGELDELRKGMEGTSETSTNNVEEEVDINIGTMRQKLAEQLNNESSGLTYACKVPSCIFRCKNRKSFVTHMGKDHSSIDDIARYIHLEGVGVSRTNPAPIETNGKTIKLRAGYLDVVKDSDGVEYVCKIAACNYMSKDRIKFINHWRDYHLKITKSKTECLVCNTDVYKSPPKTLLMSFLSHVEEQHLGMTESNPFSFTISEVLSLADDSSDKPDFVIENVQSLAEEAEDTKTWKLPSAIATLLELPDQLYKCPQRACTKAFDSRTLFEFHIISEHAGNALVCCLYCDVKMYISQVGTHIDLHHLRCRYSCSKCFYRAIRVEYVIVHMRNAHKGGNEVIALSPKCAATKAKLFCYSVKDTCAPYTCGNSACLQEFFYQREFVDHLKNAHDGVMECGYEVECDFKCVFSNNMIEHWRTHGCYTFNCLICKMGTMELGVMVEHYATTHPNREPLVADRRNSQRGLPYGYTEEAFHKAVLIKSELVASVSSEGYRIVNAQEKLALEVIEIDDDEESQEVIVIEDDNECYSEELLVGKYGKLCPPDGKNLKCPLCADFKTKNVSFFIHHVLQELKCETVKCSLCGFSTDSAESMTGHCKTNHNISQVNTIPADIGAGFWLQFLITAQAKAITSKFVLEIGKELQSFCDNTQCHYCKRWFSGIDMLTEHQLYHWAHLSYVCDYCSNKEASLDAMLDHFKDMHSNCKYLVSANGPSLLESLSTVKIQSLETDRRSLWEQALKVPEDA